MTNGGSNPSWTATASSGTPLCPGLNCGFGAFPHGGNGWIRFDGATDGLTAYSASVQQILTIPAGSIATLSYYVKAAAVSSPTNSVLTVSVGGSTVQTVNEPSLNDPDYVLRMVDLSAFADGIPRTLSFNYERPGGSEGSDTLLVDDVAVGITCGSSMSSISGRVLTPNGTGMLNAKVVLTDQMGTRRIATTSSFGVFAFDNVVPAQAYVVSASSKRYRFAAKSMVVTASLTNLEFWGLQ